MVELLVRPSEELLEDEELLEEIPSELLEEELLELNLSELVVMA